MAVRLVVVCGYPVAGKSTMARGLAEALGGVHSIDIDALRRLVLGMPHPRPNESDELTKLDRTQMLMSYQLLLSGAAYNIQLGRSVIITATFSRKVHRIMLREMLKQVMKVNFGMQLCVVQCVLEMDFPQAEDDEIRRRFMRPVESAGAVTTPERYYEVKRRYENFDVNDHDLDFMTNRLIVVNTAPPKTPEQARGEVLKIMDPG